MQQIRTLQTGFTLVELMISIALVVVLMLGITKVFSLTSQTAGATNQMSSAMRDGRGAQSVLYQDLSTAVSDGAPCMLICSSRVSAFRNKADRDGDRDIGTATDPALTVDLNGDNLEGTGQGETISPATYNYRSHRLDTFSFFSRQRLERQTGGTSASVTAPPETPLRAPMSSGEAWIWYGHLNQPNNVGSFTTATDPGQGTSPAGNENNYYASQWILARQAILLRTKDTTGNIFDHSPTPQAQAFIEAKSLASAGITPLETLAPLAHLSTSVPGAKPYTMEQSRFDLAATSIDDFLGRLNAWFANPALTAPATDNWWGELFCDPHIRFQGSRFLIPHPTTADPALNAFSYAQQAPIFLSGCSQFIVEYAGDFLVQDTDPASPTYGRINNVYTNNAGVGDGQVDFIITQDVNGNKARKIRWYGLPRDTDGVTTATPPTVTGVPDNQIPVIAGSPQLMGDVLPLRDVWRMSATAPPTPVAPFEKFSWTKPTSASPQVPATRVAANPTLTDFGAGGSGDYMSPTSGMGPNDYYICAFGPSDPKPKMIRITITLDDPAGKLPDGQTFEYVFTLP
jgi:prepilin-type N-terminal cleavage/methylation domain-containing protein